MLIKKYKKLAGIGAGKLLVSEGSLKVINGGEYILLALFVGASGNGTKLSRRTLEILKKIKEELFSEVRV